MPNEMPHQMMRHNHAKALHDKIAKKAPIDGIWIGDLDDKSTWGIHFKNTVTDPQIIEANAELQAYDTLPTVVEAEAKRASEKIANFAAERYSLFHQMALTNMRFEAKVSKKVDAETYIDSCWVWISELMESYYQHEAAILAIASDAVKDKKTKEEEIGQYVDNIDLSPFDATDPKVTIKMAKQKLEQ